MCVYMYMYEICVGLGIILSSSYTGWLSQVIICWNVMCGTVPHRDDVLSARPDLGVSLSLRLN